MGSRHSEPQSEPVYDVTVYRSRTSTGYVKQAATRLTVTCPFWPACPFWRTSCAFLTDSNIRVTETLSVRIFSLVSFLLNDRACQYLLKQLRSLPWKDPLIRRFPNIDQDFALPWFDRKRSLALISQLNLISKAIVNCQFTKNLR